MFIERCPDETYRGLFILPTQTNRYFFREVPENYHTFASNLIPPGSHLITPDSLLPILQSPQVSGSSRRLPKVPVSGFRGGGGAGVSWLGRLLSSSIGGICYFPGG